MPEPYAVWLDRDVVSATGPEAATFLQGQLSQDVLALRDGESAWSWILAPTGKVDLLVRVTRRSNDDWLLDTDGGSSAALVTRLNRFKLRTKVEFIERSWLVLGLRGDLPAEMLAGTGAVGSSESVAVGPPWPGLAGVDVLGPARVVPEGLPLVAAEEYESIRIVAGIPRMGAELTEKTIPAETGLNDLTVSFTKGCYTGQELVARIDSRGGNVPRHLRGLILPDQVAPTTELIDDEGNAAGTVTSVARRPAGGWVALGYVRRAVAVPGWLRAGPGGPEVEVRELPL